MCGICGVVRVGPRAPGPAVDAQVLDAMTDLLVHRGPSDRGTYLAEGVAFGARRLSIIDVAHGHQPFSNENGGVWAVQNGEIFNHAALREQLSQHTFESHCDTEIIPHLYEEHGVRFPEHLRGMFAVAVWDEKLRRAVLVRDRLGKKPLYYALIGDRVVFASELKSILASGLVAAELDLDSVDAYLTLGFFPTPYTPLRGVRKLPPGHVLVADENGIVVEPYWTYPEADPQPMTLDEAADLVFAKLDESVRLRLMSDVPLGAMLSGGLDSSVVVALMARHMDRPVTTFSVGFVEDDASELADARRVAQLLGTDHHELELSMRHDLVPLETLAWYLDEPLADLSALGFYALSGLAAQHVTVALSGQGADELFGGYPAHRNAATIAAVHALPGATVAAAAVARLGPRRWRRASRILSERDATERFLLQQSLSSDALRASLLAPTAAATGQVARERVRDHIGPMTMNPLGAALRLQPRLQLVDDMLQYFDRASMAHSLEVRVPFLDHELVEAAARIPQQHKLRRRVTKVVLKEVGERLLPHEVVHRPKVGFFNAVTVQWMRTQGLTETRERLLARDAATRDLFDGGALTRLVRDDVPSIQRARLLFAVLMLELWLGTVVPRAQQAGCAARAA